MNLAAYELLQQKRADRTLPIYSRTRATSRDKGWKCLCRFVQALSFANVSAFAQRVSDGSPARRLEIEFGLPQKVKLQIYFNFI